MTFTRRLFISSLAVAAMSNSLKVMAQSATTKGKTGKNTPVTPLDVAINKSGRQRMLSQRIAKAYVQIYLKILPPRSELIFEESVKLFEAELAELLQFIPANEIKDALQAQQKAWGDMKALLKLPPQKENLPLVNAASDAVLATAQRATLAYEALTVSPADELVNLAGRQRMLSQRIGKLYMLDKAGVGNFKAEIGKARGEFEKAHAILLSSPVTTVEIRRDLETVGGQFRLAMDSFIGGDIPIDQRDALVAKSTEVILAQMEVVTSAYQAR